MEETKTAEGIKPDCHFQDESGEWMWAYSEKLFTHQQEINTQLKAELESWKTENFENVDQANKTIDELKKRLSEAESAIEGSDIKIHDLKKQNAELLEALKESLIDQNARYNILMIKALNSNEQNPEKTMYGEEAAIVLKRMKATQKLLENTPPKN